MPDYANLSTAEVVHDFAVVRGDLSEQYARDQLTRAVNAKVAEAERRIEQDHENDILDAERRGAVDALRSVAAAWAELQVPDGRWKTGEIADWLSIKADLVAEGGDF